MTLSTVEIADCVAENYAEDIALPSDVATWTIDELTTFLESGGVTLPVKSSSSVTPSESEEEEEVPPTGAAPPEPEPPRRSSRLLAKAAKEESGSVTKEAAATPTKPSFPDPPVNAVEESPIVKSVSKFFGGLFGRTPAKA